MKKGKVISKCPKNLYHLSETNHDGEWFYPRVPESICKEMGEDDSTKRVCFSSSICGAFFAISFYGDRKGFTFIYLVKLMQSLMTVSCTSLQRNRYGILL